MTWKENGLWILLCGLSKGQENWPLNSFSARKVSNSCGKVVSGAHHRLLCTKLHTVIAMRASRFHQLWKHHEAFAKLFMVIYHFSSFSSNLEWGTQSSTQRRNNANKWESWALWEGSVSKTAQLETDWVLPSRTARKCRTDEMMLENWEGSWSWKTPEFPIKEIEILAWERQKGYLLKYCAHICVF